jgi:hypothetical protein
MSRVLDQHMQGRLLLAAHGSAAHRAKQRWQDRSIANAPARRIGMSRCVRLCDRERSN